ncbi:hypothetical protein [Pseudogracilibacillus auburnensis]|uniref:hypothetical protein n=1 Tax=Pseudogracilibacillus auburnensis TaxID=1494959 RepID=UPI001A96A494|nr:hypothetical protein [Pseudogracilibacillus auburnensis]MBO1005308.1 hypothetical protein [Pseudogracilibacillus auburnensis]
MDMSIMKLFTKTMPFFITRIFIYGIFGLAALIFLGIMVAIGFLVVKMFGESSGAFLIVMLIAFGVVYGALRFVERYVLYMIKIGHVSVIVELLRTGKIPEGKGQVAYGKEQVTTNFGTANVAFVLDSMVHAAVRQIQRWIMRVGDMFSFIPGSKNVIGIINAIMSIALNYIDEAIVSYIFVRKSEGRDETVWKSASDGVVLYAQSWKGILKTSVGSVIFIYLFNIVVFLIFAFPLMFLSKMVTSNTPDAGFLFGALALIGAYVLTTLLKRALIDPLVTIAMIRSYQINIRNLEPAMDLQQKLLGVSSKFKNLVNKSKQEENSAV